MPSGLKISKKHGVNPCIPICAFCGREKQEIALLGKLKGDAEAPRTAILDYTPCDECLDNWSKGIALIRASKSVLSPLAAAGFPPLQEDPKVWPTGSYSVITPEAAKRILNIDGTNGSVVLLDEDIYDSLIGGQDNKE